MCVGGGEGDRIHQLQFSIKKEQVKSTLQKQIILDLRLARYTDTDRLTNIVLLLWKETRYISYKNRENYVLHRPTLKSKSSFVSKKHSFYLEERKVILFVIFLLVLLFNQHGIMSTFSKKPWVSTRIIVIINSVLSRQPLNRFGSSLQFRSS